jgi:hypothetical protein
MESKWKLILHEQCEDPYYEITNGPISLVANCGFVGEDDADEDNIFNRVKDELNISGIDFHSGNKLELKQYIEKRELQYKVDELKERCEKMAQEHADLTLALAAMLNGYQNLSMYQRNLFTVPKDLIDAYTKMVLEYDTHGKEEESNTPAPVQGEEEVDNGQ